MSSLISLTSVMRRLGSCSIFGVELEEGGDGDRKLGIVGRTIRPSGGFRFVFEPSVGVGGKESVESV